MRGRGRTGGDRYLLLLPICLGLGVSLGAAIHNIGVGMVIGTAVGTILALLGWTLANRRL